MAPRRRRLGAVWFLLSVALAASGCEVGCGDWDFGAVEEEFAGVDAPAPDAEAVTVVLVQDEEWAAQYFVRVGADQPTASGDDRLRVSYRFEGANYQRRPPVFATAARGDSVFVYVEGTFDDSIFHEACSPPVPYLTVDVLGVSAPDRVGRVAFAIANTHALSASDLAFLRDTEAARRLHRTTPV